MKKIILISSHCEDQEKKNVLIHNIKKLKKNDFDIILYSTINLENEIVDLCDYYIFSKINPILKYPLKGMGAWRHFHIKDEIYSITHIFDDYGWAGLTQYKNMLSLVRNLDYDVIYLMIYDIELTDILIDVLKNNEKTLFFPSKHKNKNKQWEVGSHLMCLNKKDIDIFLDESTLEKYLENDNNYLEKFIEEIQTKHNWKVSNVIVEDLINRFKKPFEKKTLLNKTKVYFINDLNKNIFGFLFYDVIVDFNVKLIVNNTVDIQYIEKDTIIFCEKPINKLLLEIDGNEINFTEKINQYTQNLFKKINNEYF